MQPNKCLKRQFAFVLGRVKDFLSHMEVGRGGYGNKAGSRQSSREWLGRSSIAKTARNSQMWRTYRRTDIPTYRPTRQGVESRARD